MPDKQYNFLKSLTIFTTIASIAVIAADYLGKYRNIGWCEEVRESDISRIKKCPPPFDFYFYSKSRENKRKEDFTDKAELKYKHGDDITHREEILEYLRKTWGPCAPHDINHFNEQIADSDFVAAYYKDKESNGAPERPVGFLRTMWRCTDNGLYVPVIFSDFYSLTKNNTWEPDNNSDTLILVDCGNFGNLKRVAPTCIEAVFSKELPEFEKIANTANIITYSPDSAEAKRLHESVARQFDQKLWKGPVFRDSRPEWPDDFSYKKPKSYVRNVNPMIYRGCRNISKEHYNPNQLIFWKIRSTPKPSR